MNNAWQPSFWKRHARKILLISLAALAIYDVFGAHGFLATWRTRKQLRDMREQVERLHQENEQLTRQVNSLKTDPQAIERVAREKMGLARPGEMIFKLPPPPENSSAESGAR